MSSAALMPLPEWAATATRGHRRFKLKIGFGRDADLPAVETAEALAGPGCFAVDVNQAWNLEEAASMAAALALVETDHNENPLRDALAVPLPVLQDGACALPQAPGLGAIPNLEPAAPWQQGYFSAVG